MVARCAITLVFTCCWVSGLALKTFYLDEICGPFSPSKGVIRLSNTFEGSNSSGILKATRFGPYRDDWMCSVTFLPPLGNGIVVSFRDVNFRESCVDNITLTSGSLNSVYCQHISDSDERSSYIGSSDVTLTFKTARQGSTLSRGFELTFTAYHKGVCSNTFDYSCGNGNCISAVFTCDGHNHCGDLTDQNGCVTRPLGYTIFFGFGMLFLVIACISGTLYCCRKRDRSTATVYHQQAPVYGTIGPPPPQGYYYSQVPQTYYPPHTNNPYYGTAAGNPGFK